MNNSNKNWLKFWYFCLTLGLLLELFFVYAYVVKQIEAKTFLIGGFCILLNLVVALKNIRHFRNKLEMK